MMKNRFRLRETHFSDFVVFSTYIMQSTDPALRPPPFVLGPAVGFVTRQLALPDRVPA